MGPDAREQQHRTMTKAAGGVAPRAQTVPLTVLIVHGEIVVDGMQSSAPSLSSYAARETGKRLIAAADKLSAR